MPVHMMNTINIPPFVTCRVQCTTDYMAKKDPTLCARIKGGLIAPTYVNHSEGPLWQSYGTWGGEIHLLALSIVLGVDVLMIRDWASKTVDPTHIGNAVCYVHRDERLKGQTDMQLSLQATADILQNPPRPTIVIKMIGSCHYEACTVVGDMVRSPRITMEDAHLY